MLGNRDFPYPQSLNHYKQHEKSIKGALLLNQLTIDLLTAKERGLCKVQNDFCCFSFPVNYRSVTDLIEHMKTEDLSQDLSVELLMWFSSWKVILTMLIPVRFIILAMYV